jgi:hypothetical protein
LCNNYRRVKSDLPPQQSYSGKPFASDRQSETPASLIQGLDSAAAADRRAQTCRMCDASIGLLSSLLLAKQDIARVLTAGIVQESLTDAYPRASAAERKTVPIALKTLRDRICAIISVSWSCSPLQEGYFRRNVVVADVTPVDCRSAFALVHLARLTSISTGI